MARDGSEVEATPPNGRQRWRDRVTLALVVLTSVAVLGAVVGVWVRLTLLDTDRFMAAVAPTLEDPAFYDALGDFAGQEVVEALAIEARLEEMLGRIDDAFADAVQDATVDRPRARSLVDRVDRPQLAALAPALASPLEESVSDAVHGAVRSDAVVDAVPELVRGAHRGVVALADGATEATPNIRVVDGEVRLNLLSLVVRASSDVNDRLRGVLPDLALPAAVPDRADDAIARIREVLGASAAEDVGQLTLLSESQLDELQRVARQLRWAVWALVAAPVMLAVMTLVQSRYRRHAAVRLAVGATVALLTGGVVLRRLQARLVAGLEGTVDGELVGTVVDGVLSGLRGLLAMLIVIALLLAIVIHAAGRPSWLARLRAALRRLVVGRAGGSELDRWIATHADALRTVVGAAAIVGALVSGFDLVVTTVGGVVLAALLGGIVRARRRTDAHVDLDPEDLVRR